MLTPSPVGPRPLWPRHRPTHLVEELRARGVAADQEKVLNPVFAGELMFKGLLNGRCGREGSCLLPYLPTGGPEDLKNVRRTVNITDP